MSVEQKTVTRKRVLVETKVVVEPGWIPSWARDGDANKEWLERWAKELMAFFRDHRSMDVNSVCAEPVYEQQCSGCGHEWEEMIDEDTGHPCCACCGVPMEVVR